MSERFSFNLFNRVARLLLPTIIIAAGGWFAAAIAQSPAPPKVAAAPNRGGKQSAGGQAPARTDKQSNAQPQIDQANDSNEELREALALFVERDARRHFRATVDARRELTVTPDQRREFRRHLPSRLEERIDAEQTARLAAVAAKVFALMKTPDRELIVFKSEKPYAATWKGYYVLMSSRTARLLSDAEISAQIAHEMAHLLWTNKLRRALETGDERAARILELKCDAMAIIALDLLGLPAAAFASGLEKMTRVRGEEFGLNDDSAALHAPLAVRRELARRIIELLAAKAAAKPAVPK